MATKKSNDDLSMREDSEALDMHNAATLMSAGLDFDSHTEKELSTNTKLLSMVWEAEWERLATAICQLPGEYEDLKDLMERITLGKEILTSKLGFFAERQVDKNLRLKKNIQQMAQTVDALYRDGFEKLCLKIDVGSLPVFFALMKLDAKGKCRSVRQIAASWDIPYQTLRDSVEAFYEKHSKAASFLRDYRNRKKSKRALKENYRAIEQTEADIANKETTILR